MPTPTRKSRRAVDRSERPDRQQDILLAAEKLFAQHGYRAVSIRQIAEEAGVPLALVSYYHGQKHELFKAIFDHWRPTVDERLSLLAQALQGPPDAAMLRRVIEALVLPVLFCKLPMAVMSSAVSVRPTAEELTAMARPCAELVRRRGRVLRPVSGARAVLPHARSGHGAGRAL